MYLFDDKKIKQSLLPDTDFDASIKSKTKRIACINSYLADGVPKLSIKKTDSETVNHFYDQLIAARNQMRRARHEWKKHWMAYYEDLKRAIEDAIHVELGWELDVTQEEVYVNERWTLAYTFLYREMIIPLGYSVTLWMPHLGNSHQFQSNAFTPAFQSETDLPSCNEIMSKQLSDWKKRLLTLRSIGDLSVNAITNDFGVWENELKKVAFEYETLTRIFTTERAKMLEKAEQVGLVWGDWDLVPTNYEDL